MKDQDHSGRAIRPPLPAARVARSFHHIRRFGFLGPRVATARLQLIRALLGVKPPEPVDTDKVRADEPERQDGPNKSRPCCYCGVGRMALIAEIPRPTVAQIMQWPTSLETPVRERPRQMYQPLTACT